MPQTNTEENPTAAAGATGHKGRYTIALAGNPNSGKTTAFNHFTGSRQHVANYPGITVEQKYGDFSVHGQKVRMIDLPGTYSLTAYSDDELVARRGLAEEKPDCVIDIINANALERNLYLGVQIMEMGLPVVLALNMYDETKKQGVEINHERLAEVLGVPVFPTIARTGEGLGDVLHAAMHIARGDYRDGKGVTAPRPAHKGKGQNAQATAEKDVAEYMHTPHGKHVHGSRQDQRLLEKYKVGTPLYISYGPDLDPVLEEMAALVEENKLFASTYPARWVALKYMENDAEIRSKGQAADPALSTILESKVETVAKHLKTTMDTYPEAVIASYRYGYISSLLRQDVIIRHNELRERVAMSDKIDRVLTNRFAGPLIMLGILYVMYKITFFVGEIPMGWVENFFGWLNETVSDNMSDGFLKSMITAGIIDGVGGVMGFVPLIMFMFLQISVLEDSGYMARVAYMLDRVFRAFGLHGYSVMPYIVSGGIAGGCAVPGVMAARTLRSPKEKLATLLTVPFMTCGAKLPVFILLAAVFFPGSETEVMILLSLTAWGTALLVALLLRKTVIKGEATPFVMELPPYRFPTIFGVLLHTWERIWQYIKKAGTIILAISILIWASMTFPGLPAEKTEGYEQARAALEEQIENASNDEAKEELQAQLEEIEQAESAEALANSAAGRVGRAIEPLTAPAGFEWRTNIALVGGVAAKEVIVSTLGTAYSLGEVDPEEAESLQQLIGRDPHWNKANAAALMVFVLLYAPCFVTLVVIKQEAESWKWAVFSLVFNTLLAYVAAVGVYQIGKLIIA